MIVKLWARRAYRIARLVWTSAPAATTHTFHLDPENKTLAIAAGEKVVTVERFSDYGAAAAYRDLVCEYLDRWAMRRTKHLPLPYRHRDAPSVVQDPAQVRLLRLAQASQRSA